MINILKKKFSFINNFNFTFSKLNQKFNDKDFSALKTYFKRQILKTAAGDIFFYGGARMGIYLIMKYLNLKKSDEVIVTAFTCSVVINSIKRFGSKPIYADIDPLTLGTCPEDIKKKITNNTKLIIAQHSFGIPCDIDKIMRTVKKKKSSF